MTEAAQHDADSAEVAKFVFDAGHPEDQARQEYQRIVNEGRQAGMWAC
eukprot:CAMPEP_0118920228 /NCGR_PEP_ID=MMETSP1166-20130328/18958_1 /TAXON_ID=1104430 /ORGANISM="Chrysoreinhardia sp, Strain CCMP3193" /LENGTH=47 /DNA_ID= /DNA_START= /DNA_END= /DNA_ORIENTATION=